MRGFRKLVILGVFLVTLLVVIDIIDAGKKEPRKKELESKIVNEREKTKNTKYEKAKKLESFKQEKTKKSGKATNIEEEKQFTENPKLEPRKYKVKKAAKYTSKDSKTINDGLNPKMTKTYQKVKKHKTSEENEPIPEYTTKEKKTQTPTKETVDETVKSVKKSSQKKGIKENIKVPETVDEELNQVHDENIEDETISSKRKKYKLVEVVLEEDGEEDNETYIEIGSEEDRSGGIESEEVNEILRMQTAKIPRIKRVADKNILSVEEDLNEEFINEEDNNEETAESGYSEDLPSGSSKYEDPLSQTTCKPLPEDPNRVGPKKVVLYVIEEEINGEIKKRVVSEEDGVTMCEVADLMKEHYYAGLL